SAPEADVGRDIDGAHEVVGAVVEGFDGGLEGPCTGSITVGRHGEAQRIVRAVVIVAVPPAVECLLGLLEIAEGATLEQLGLECAIEALVLAMALRVER